MLFSLVISSRVGHAVVQNSGSYCYHLGISNGVTYANVLVYTVDKHHLISFYY